MSSIFTLCDIRIADQLDFDFGIRCYRLMLAGSGSRVYCKEVKRTADRDYLHHVNDHHPRRRMGALGDGLYRCRPGGAHGLPGGS